MTEFAVKSKILKQEITYQFTVTDYWNFLNCDPSYS